MDSSGDSSFVTYKHFPDLDFSPDAWLDKIKAKSEGKKSFMQSGLKAALQSLKVQERESLETNILNTQTKASTAKADLELKLQVINELKIKTEILESELRNIVGNTSQENIEDLLREVVTLENEKKQRLEKLVRHRDAIIKIMDCYKYFLDCHLIFTKPDIYTFYFHRKSESGSLSKNWLSVRTDDYKYWHFTDASVSLKEKEKLFRMLKENGNIHEILCEVRKMCR